MNRVETGATKHASINGCFGYHKTELSENICQIHHIVDLYSQPPSNKMFHQVPESHATKSGNSPVKEILGKDLKAFPARLFQARLSPILFIALLVASISLLTRIILLLKVDTGFDWSIKNVSGTFGLGLIYDLSMCAYLVIPFVLQIWASNERIYKPKMRWVTFAGFLLIISLLVFSDIIPKDFNKNLYKAVLIYTVVRFAIFSFLCFKSVGFRKKWRTGVLYFSFFILIFGLVFNAISEWFFWDEFSTRYNFIAVDYLVYTNEVLGNIKESYPINWILCGVAILSFAIFLIVRPWLRISVYNPSPFLQRSVVAATLLTIIALVHFEVKPEWKNFSKNEYANELAGNGIYQFGVAFWNNELDFFKFYQTIPDEEAFRIVKNDLKAPNAKFISNDIYNLEREISYNQPEQHYNIVLISVESLSGDFMNTLGGHENVTPHLDSLVSKSIFFNNLYASGTRTVRGLEALSLSIPPTPGQSIVKRPHNEDLFSLGSVLKSKGYITQYIYGGYSYFDNMKYFFGHNGYSVIDRERLKPDEVHYQNVWGVADEDLFAMAEKVLDKNYAEGKPFFSQIMTVSNHKPFTYPDGRIDIPASNHSRNGAVKYTDYAINKFLQQSESKPWFEKTIFVIVADHCAGSAGSTQLPVTGYHIPMLIYAPKIVQPQTVDRITAQIDIAPTILGLLHMHYNSKFFGQDVLNTPDKKEAFISTYQGLGFLSGNELIIQSPKKKIRAFVPDFKTGAATEVPVKDSLAKKAIAYYQVASWLIKHDAYKMK